MLFQAIIYLCAKFHPYLFSTLTASNPTLGQLDGLLYEYDDDGVPYLVDPSLAERAQSPNYNPDRQNQYHLFTRQNPRVSQPLLAGNQQLLNLSNFNARRKTVFVLHGWRGSVTGNSITTLIAGALASEDTNVIGVDWSIGANTNPANFYNALASAQSVARFINWLGTVGVRGSNVVIIGFSLGGQQAGMIGRYTNERISYISALDPPQRGNNFEFRASDGAYTEVIHTHSTGMGGQPIGQVDFYPNRGFRQPGCGNDNFCNHARAYHFMAESMVSGGFTGIECESLQHASNGRCGRPGRLRMGGLVPKNGRTGIYFLETNAAPPFSRG
ncbi:hypothetical protein ABMA28_012563 [Loxostege sticticalis]|uniref:Lipase domain-containing protein n=1 Tax=Loxostege sticticalis TaxID=481309 RepID=A0ABD0S490_LOXSC